MRTGPPPYAISNPKSWDELAEPGRSRLWQARNDCLAETGHELGLNSGKRTDWMQYQLRTPDRGIPDGHQWDPAYPGHPLTAIPGRSQHRNLGVQPDGSIIFAADLYQGPALQWLRAHREEYGISFPLPSEDWHAQCHGTPTRTIRPYPGAATEEISMSDIQDLNDKLDKVLAAVGANQKAVLLDEATDNVEADRASNLGGSIRGLLFAIAEEQGLDVSPGSKLRKRAAEIDKSDTFAQRK